MKPLVLTILLLAGTLTRDEMASIAKLADCEKVVCLRDAYYTLHAPNRGATFFFHARMLQLYPRNSISEIALLETLPSDAKEADTLLSFTAVDIDGNDERELRDEIANDILEIYERAAERHREYAQRLSAASPLIREARERSRLPAAPPGPLSAPLTPPPTPPAASRSPAAPSA